MPEDDLKVTEPEEAPPEKPAGGSRLERLKHWYLDRKKWTVPASVLVLILLLAIVPWTRYKVAGLVIKKEASIFVTDSVSGDPVSAADVQLAGKHAQTSGQGYALFHHVAVGPHQVTVSKKYYQPGQLKVTVGFHNHNAFPIKFVATGRQVKLVIKDLVTQKPLAGVDIKVADVSAKTDATGSALAVLPADTTSEKGTLSLGGYNTAAVDVKVADKQITENDYILTPAGSVYFLSKLSGKIDVVKTNLDGSGRQTVLAGTGKEDDQNTVLLASRDWKYLALYSRRAGNSPSIYLIDTSNDSLTTIDSGDVNFTLLGWSDNYFTYIVGRPGVQPWQPNAGSIESYNAQTKKLSAIDNTSASGSSVNDAIYETYIDQPILLDNLIVYVKTWYKYPGYLQVNGQSNTFNIVKPDGSGKRIIKSVDAAQSYFNMVFHAPGSIYLQVNDINGGNGSYYEFNGIGVTQKNNLTNDDIFRTYPTYLYSPDDSQTFWSEPRDGKNTLFIGDNQGQNPKQIVTLSDYTPYGWYSDNYLLVSKNGSELYIMAKDGSQPPIKISDYHKPVQKFYGYGGGYGGL